MSGSTKPADTSRILARHRLKIRVRRLIPTAVWVVTLVVTVSLYIRQESGFTVTGFAEEIRYRVATETPGRLEQLEVTLNQDVTRGQIVASFDDDDLRLRLQEARLDLDRLTHELGRETALWELDTAGQQVDQQTNLRRFAEDASRARIEYLTAMATLAEDRITQQGLELILSRSSQLGASELIADATLDADRIAYKALGESIEKQESTVATLLTASHDADARYRIFTDNYVANAPDAALVLKPLQSAIDVQEVRIEMVNLAIVRRVLRAPAAGRVAEIFCRAGEVVAAGQPVLSILEPRATELVAYLPENHMLDRQPGDEVKVRRVADPDQTFVASITGLGPSVNQNPGRLDPTSLIPSWGRPVYIPLPSSLTAVPGEAFVVSF